MLIYLLHLRIRNLKYKRCYLHSVQVIILYTLFNKFSFQNKALLIFFFFDAASSSALFQPRLPLKSGRLGWKIISVMWLVEIVGVSSSFSFQHHCSFRGPVFLFTNTDSQSLQETDSSRVGWLHTRGDASHAWSLWQTLQYWVDPCC